MANVQLSWMNSQALVAEGFRDDLMDQLRSHLVFILSTSSLSVEQIERFLRGMF